MAYQEIRFNLPVVVIVDGPSVDAEKLEKQIIRFLSYEDDHRNNLERECIDRDLTALAKSAVNIILQDSCLPIRHCGASIDLE